MNMKFNETKKVGMDIFFINVILLLFIYSKDGFAIFNLILASVSSIVAVILNVYYIYTGSKTKINKVFLLVNSLVAISIIIFTIANII